MMALTTDKGITPMPDTDTVPDAVNVLKNRIAIPLLHFIDHQRGLIAALVVVAAMAMWLTACESRTVIDGARVTAAQLDAHAVAFQSSIDSRTAALQADIDSYNAALSAAAADLDRKDSIKRQVVDIAGGLATTAATGGLSIPGLVASIVGAGGLLSAAGMTVDRVRSSKQIRSLKESAEG